MIRDQAIPILPSRDLDQTIGFYRQLGFTGGRHEFDAHYAILSRGEIELHFFTHRDLQAADSYAGCYLRVTDARSWFEVCSRAALPTAGIPRLDPLGAKPWGMLEFAIVDPSGNLLRIGQEMEAHK